MSDRSEKTRTRTWAARLPRYAPSALLLCLGIGLLVFVAGAARRSERVRIEADFEQRATERVTALERELEFHALELEALAAFYAGSERVTRQDFRTFVQPLLGRHPDIRALAWVPRVPDAQRAVYEEAARSDGLPGFRITERKAQGEMVPAGRRHEYYPLCFVQPHEGNEATLGFDLASDPAHLEALNRARDTGKMAATGWITLVQETGRQYGFLLVVPIYRKDAPTSTVQERRDNLVGVALAASRIGDVLTQAIAHLEVGGVDTYLFDASAPPGRRRLHLHGSRARTTAVEPVEDEAALRAGLHHAAALDVGGRQWLVVCTPTPGFLAARRTALPWVSLIGGPVLAASAVAYLLLILNRTAREARLRRRLEHQIAQRLETEEALRQKNTRLQELEHVVNHSPAVAFLWRNAEGWPVEYVSDNVVQFGYEPDDFYSGRVPFASIVHPDDLERVAAEVATHSREGRTEFVQEYRIVTRTGDVRWLDDRTWVRRDPDGAITHYQGIVLDITERKRAEQALRDSEKKYRDVVEMASDGIAIVQDGLAKYVNPQVTEMLGHSAQQLVDMPFADYIHPAELAETIEFYKKRLAGDEVPLKYERRLRHKDGSYVSVEISGRVVPYQGEPAVLGVIRDITERKQAEQALRTKDWAIQSSISAIAFADLQGHLTYVNRSFLRLWGYDHDEELLGRSVLSFWEDERDAAAVVEALRQNGEWVGELVARRKDGSAFHTELRTSLVCDDNGQAISMMASFADITDRKRAEQALRDSEGKLNAMLQSIGDHMSMMDKDLNILWANHTARRLFGDDIVGKKCYEVYHRRTQPCEPHPCLTLKAFHDGKTHQHDTQVVAEDGQTLYFHCTANVALRDPQGQPTAVIELSRDITSRKRAEDALKESEEKHRKLFEQARDGILLGDAETGEIIDCNESAADLLGREKHELIGQSHKILHPPQNDEAQFYGTFEQHLTDKEGQVLETRVMTKTGEIKDVAIKANLLELNGRHVLQGMFRDITERKRAEQELRESEERYRTLFEGAGEGILVADVETMKFRYANPAICTMLGYRRDELVGMGVADIHPKEALERVAAEFRAQAIREQVVAEDIPCLRKGGAVIYTDIYTTPALIDGTQCNVGFFTDITERKRAEQERRELEAQMQHAQKLESLGVLAGGIAHDFNNLLAVVLGHADLALAKAPPASPLRENISEIRQAAVHASNLTHQMLAYSGKGDFAVEPLDLNELVEEIAHLLGSSIAKKAVLNFDFAKALPSIDADAAQIQQVVMNLITNASDAIGDAPGVITLRTGIMEANADYLTAWYMGEDLTEGPYVFLEVTDTGCGMDEATRQKIFDPFFTTKFTGRGLGLAATLGIMRRHHGAIKVYSEPGRGTTFRVLFPRSERALEARAAKDPAQADASPAGGTVLVVDDEDAVRTVAKAMLEHAGFTVLVADTARDGVETFRRHAGRIQAVLLDMTMPEMNGEEVFREIRGIDPTVRVVLTSGYSEHDATSHFGGEALAGFVHKPFELDTLIGTVRRAVEA